MSVADRLGTGSSFGSARTRSARGRAKAVVQGDVPGYELVRLRLMEVAPTPLNPRRNFGTEDELARFGEELRTVQLAACVAVTRAAYLTLWPAHEQQIGGASWVLVNGERRYRSAVHVGLEALDFVVRDDLVSSREDFVDHLLKENLEREDFDVIERARGVQQLVDVCSEEYDKGAQARAAERLNKDRSWVTNQLALLRLPDKIQIMLSSGEMPERDGRLLARHSKEHPELDTAGLLSYLTDTREQEAAERREERALLRAVRQRNASGALSTDQTASIVSGGSPVLSADNTEGSAPKPAGNNRVRGAVLSADNTVAQGSAPTSSGGHVLSADDTATGGDGKAARRSVLSADDTGASPAPVPAALPSGERSAQNLVRALGSTAEERAKVLAAGMSANELESLINALHEYL